MNSSGRDAAVCVSGFRASGRSAVVCVNEHEALSGAVRNLIAEKPADDHV